MNIIDCLEIQWIIDSEGLPTTTYYNGLLWITWIVADHVLLSIPKPPKPLRPSMTARRYGAGMGIPWPRAVMAYRGLWIVAA